MKHMAQRAKVSPLRISFHIASIGILNILRFDSLDSAGNLPKHLESWWCFKKYAGIKRIHY